MKTAVAACALILGEEGPGGNKKFWKIEPDPYSVLEIKAQLTQTMTNGRE